MFCVLPDTVNAVNSRNKRKGGHKARIASLRTLPIFPKPKRARVERNRRHPSCECPEARNLHELSNTESCLWVHVSAFGTKALG